MRLSFQDRKTTQTQVLALVFLCISLLSCRLFDSNEERYVHPRDFKWIADTLFYEDTYQTHLTKIWGVSCNEVYAAGHSSTLEGTLWQLHGNEWIPVVLAKLSGGNIDGAHTINDVAGTSSDDIWGVGEVSITAFDDDSALVIHFDGKEWNKVATPSGLGLRRVCVIDQNNVWFGGYYGTLFHYDGVGITSIDLPFPEDYFTTSFGYFGSIVGNSPDNIYALYYSTDFSGEKPSYLLHYNGEDWEILDRFYFMYYRQLWMSPSGSLYLAGVRNIFLWNGGKWQSFLHDYDYEFFSISGTSDTDIMIGGHTLEDRTANIRHYNGEDWYQYEVAKDYPSHFVDVWYNGRCVYFLSRVTHGGQLGTIILKGS